MTDMMLEERGRQTAETKYSDHLCVESGYASMLASKLLKLFFIAFIMS